MYLHISFFIKRNDELKQTIFSIQYSRFYLSQIGDKCDTLPSVLKKLRGIIILVSIDRGPYYCYYIFLHKNPIEVVPSASDQVA